MTNQQHIIQPSITLHTGHTIRTVHTPRKRTDLTLQCRRILNKATRTDRACRDIQTVLAVGRCAEMAEIVAAQEIVAGLVAGAARGEG